MLDADGKCWLLECNDSPGLEYCGSHLADGTPSPDAEEGDATTRAVVHDRLALLGFDRDVCVKGKPSNRPHPHHGAESDASSSDDDCGDNGDTGSGNGITNSEEKNSNASAVEVDLRFDPHGHAGVGDRLQAAALRVLVTLTDTPRSEFRRIEREQQEVYSTDPGAFAATRRRWFAGSLAPSRRDPTASGWREDWNETYDPADQTVSRPTRVRFRECAAHNTVLKNMCLLMANPNMIRLLLTLMTSTRTDTQTHFTERNQEQRIITMQINKVELTARMTLR